MLKFPLVLIAAAWGGPAFAETAVDDIAKDSGVHTCLKTVKDLAQFLVKDSTHNASVTWNIGKPDAHIVNAQISVKYSNGNSVAIINVAPTPSGKCDATYTTVFANDVSCSVARETSYKNWKFHVESAGLEVLENESGSLKKILLPAGSGCVAITTEVVYP